jgi:hypothetical protein
MSPVYCAFHCVKETPQNRGHSQSHKPEKKNEPPREYIDRFNKVAVEVKTDDRMKLYVLD